MKVHSFTIDFTEYDSTDQLDEGLKTRLKKTEEFLSHAYAPYSKFQVSAMCVLDDGTEVMGTNQENAAYPSGLCAERVAVFAAKSRFPDKKIDKIVITTAKGDDQPVTPCGGCRQVIMEYEQQQQQPIQLVLKAVDSKVWVFQSMNDLLPFAFNGSLLKKG
ncbi:MAG: cytidine deaminase [Flavobacteriales bacterium]|nr:cytidine deaminase [Flavobacteriales bacterium]